MPPSVDIIQTLLKENRDMQSLASGAPMFWNNPVLQPASKALAACAFSAEDARDAEARLRRFAPYLAEVFPETRPAGGVIESPLRAIPRMRETLERAWNQPINGNVLLKMDSHLPVSGSIKARGGLYEVLCRAEQLALDAGLIAPDQNYSRLAAPEARRFFSGYSLAVGSTGNLGLSVGLMGATLGFQTAVHMSADARQWKKELLRRRGVTVVEYADDYSAAVAAGRKACEADPRCYFVDDENSRNLFLGYAVAGLRLAGQLRELGLDVSDKRPLLAYLPCGVGGGPGGVAFGLKLAFGDAARCYFAEPTQAPAVSLGLISGLDNGISATDIGLSGKTAADGLAVSRPSALVCKAMRHLLDGAFTVADPDLFRFLHSLAETEGIRIEPSAAAGFPGVRHSALGRFGPKAAGPGAIHLVWATGGSLVPDEEWQRYDEEGKRLSALP